MFGALLEHAKLAGETAKAIEAEIRRIAFTQGVVPEEANLIAEPARARLANGEPVGLLRVHFRLVGEAGAYWLISDGTRRRVAAEGETKAVVTLYFNVRESAPPGRVLEVTLEERTFAFPHVLNWLHVRGSPADGPPVTVDVAPLLVAHGLLRVAAETTLSGDVNVNGTVDLTDPVVLLGELFLDSRGAICAEAADFNADGTLNVTDAVAILNHLFLGGPRWREEVDCAAASE